MSTNPVLAPIAQRLSQEFPALPSETVNAAVMSATSAVGERDDADTALAAVEAAARAELALLQDDVDPAATGSGS